DAESATSLDYNAIGGVFDFYFLTGSETDPAEVARQYAQIAGPTLGHLLRCHIGHLVFINAGTGIKVCFSSRSASNTLRFTFHWPNTVVTLHLASQPG
ncbi:hypothetical protein BGY98DRAFT_1054269, partial [Russula aff. rugulosa BPL654]